MSQELARFAGHNLYLDTMVFHVFLRVRNSPAEPLFRMIQAGDVQALSSVLTFDELAYRMLLASIRDKYGGSPLDRLREDEHEMVAQYPSLMLLAA